MGRFVIQPPLIASLIIDTSTIIKKIIMNPSIRPVRLSDINSISIIHKSAFLDSALAQLGIGAINRYYHWLLTGPHDAYCIGAYTSDTLFGYCFSGMFTGALSGFLYRHRLYLAWRIITHPWLIKNPLVLDRIDLARILLSYRPQKVVIKNSINTNINTSTHGQEKSFGVLAIAVDPKQQGRGIGKLLMSAVQLEAIRQNYSKMHLSVSVNNHKAIDFYLSDGWKKLLNPDSIWEGKMEKEIQS